MPSKTRGSKRMPPTHEDSLSIDQGIRSSKRIRRKTSRPFQTSHTSSPLERLPAELFANIVNELSTCQDVAYLSQVSRTIHNSFNDKDKTIWCKYFRQVFDGVSGPPARDEFVKRRNMYRDLFKAVIVKDSGGRGPFSSEQTAKSLVDFISETNTSGQRGASMKTMSRVFDKLLEHHSVFLSCGNLSSSINLSTLRFLGPAILTMLHVAFKKPISIYGGVISWYEDSKLVAYHDERVYPLLIDQQREVGLQTRPHATNLLLLANYFRCQWIGAPIGNSHPCFAGFDSSPLQLPPQPWAHCLNDTSTSHLEGVTYWKGCLSTICAPLIDRWKHDGALDPTVIKQGQATYCQSKSHRAFLQAEAWGLSPYSEEDFDEIRIDFLADTDGEMYWPDDFDASLPLAREANADVNSSTRRHLNGEASWVTSCLENVPIVGLETSRCSETRISGNMHPLAETCGINGFKRISFARGSIVGSSPTDYEDATRITCKKLLQQVNRGLGLHDEDMNMHGFEGVILPGGNIMLGRWFEIVDDNLPPLLRAAPAPGYGPDVPMTAQEHFAECIAGLPREVQYSSSGPFMYWRVPYL